MNRQGRMLVSGAFLSSQRIFEYGYVPVTVSEMPVPQLSHKSRNGPITAICGGRPAMTRKKLPIKKKKVVCVGTESNLNVTLTVPARIVLFFFFESNSFLLVLVCHTASKS